LAHGNAHRFRQLELSARRARYVTARLEDARIESPAIHTYAAAAFHHFFVFFAASTFRLRPKRSDGPP
jgi:hypothetical protein